MSRGPEDGTGFDGSSEKNNSCPVASKVQPSQTIPTNETREAEKSEDPNGSSKLPDFMKWIPENWTWSKIKPAIRCAVAAWIGAVLFAIPRIEVFLGQVRNFGRIRVSVLIYGMDWCQASFLVLIGATLHRRLYAAN